MALRILLVMVAGLMLAADAADDELKKLEGIWAMTYGEEKGEKLFDEKVMLSRLLMLGEKHTVLVGKVKIVGTHKVDPTKKPAEIDASDTEGPYKDKTVLGIYKLEKDQFTVCFAGPGKARPKEFTTKAGTGEILHVWKREKK